MKFPRYFIASNDKEFPNQEFVICTERPYLVAGVMRYKDPGKAAHFAQTSEQLLKIKIPGYNIFLFLKGSIEGSRLEFTPDWKEKYTKELVSMGAFFIEEKLNKSPYVYARYAEDKTDKRRR